MAEGKEKSLDGNVATDDKETTADTKNIEKDTKVLKPEVNTQPAKEEEVQAEKFELDGESLTVEMGKNHTYLVRSDDGNVFFSVSERLVKQSGMSVVVYYLLTFLLNFCIR